MLGDILRNAIGRAGDVGLFQGRSPALQFAFLSGLFDALLDIVVADELRGFARLMRSLARRPEIPANVRAIDIVGTGGDASGSVNISPVSVFSIGTERRPVPKYERLIAMR